MELYEIYNEITKLIYVGATKRRLNDSLNDFRHFNSIKKEHPTNIFFIDTNHGTKIRHIRWLEDLSYQEIQKIIVNYCDEKNKEGGEKKYIYMIRKPKYKKGDVNYRTYKQYRKYYEQNRTKYLLRSKLTYANRKEYVREYMRLYREENREKIRKKNKEYSKKHSEKLKERVNCHVCDKELSYGSLKRHIKTLHK